MLLMRVDNQRIGEDRVTCFQTSNVLESLVTWKLGRRVRRRAVGKVPSGNSLAAYPTAALGNFSIFLSHNGWVPICGSLPVIRARFGRLSAGVSHLPSARSSFSITSIKGHWFC